MAANGHSHDHCDDHAHDHEHEIEVPTQIFEDLSKIEREIADVQIVALRKSEHNLAPIYQKRAALLSQIPSFWPQVLLKGPKEFRDILASDVDEDDEIGNIDIATIGCVTNLTVERYQLTSETEGEPRSLRFTFEFDPSRNPIFEDAKVVKEFEYASSPDGESGGLISKPVTFKWTKKGKRLVQKKTGGLLDLAFQLYQAEEAARFNIKGADGKKSAEVSMVDRETLWQYEKLREKMEQIENQLFGGEDTDADAEDVAGIEGCWLDWFGYRGPVDIRRPQEEDAKTKTKVKADSNGESKDNDQSEDDDSEDEEVNPNAEPLDVEIFPAGEAIATSLAEDLWPSVMDYFTAQDPDSDDEDEMNYLGLDEDEDEDDEVPELISTAEFDGVSSDDDDNDDKDDKRGGEDTNPRPSKKQRTG